MNSQERLLLDEIWSHFLGQKEWPTAWDLYSPNRKSAVQGTLKRLTGNVVMEVSDSQHGSRLQLQLLGVLLTSDGPGIEALITHYFSFIRSRYQSRPQHRTIQSGEVQAALQLEDRELKLLGRLILVGNLFSGSASYDGKWDSKDWSVGILEKVEDFPPEGDLAEQVEILALRGFNMDDPVFLEDRRLMTEQNRPLLHTRVEDRPHVDDPGIVFVVHGRNEALRKSMFDFLRSIGLKPLEWSQAVAATREASPYIGQVLDTAFSKAQAVVVLMTPDDEAWLKKEFQSDHEEPYERQLTGQARPNVLFEAGMAMGRDPKRTVLVQIGDLRPFSDVGGRHVLRMNNSSTKRQELANRLKTAGCPVDLSGTDWHTVGSFVLVAPETKSNPGGKDRPTESASAEFDEVQIKILRIVAEVDGERVRAEELASALGMPVTRLRYIADGLQKSGHLHSPLMMGGGTQYMIADKGRAYLVERNLI